jgi:hypothetical protein
MRLWAPCTRLADSERRLGWLYVAMTGGIAHPSKATLEEGTAIVKTKPDIARATSDGALAEMRLKARIALSVLRDSLKRCGQMFRRMRRGPG